MKTNENKNTEVPEGLGAVIWTDGSSRPNPGQTGWGVHGYFFKMPEEGVEAKKTIINQSMVATNEGYIFSCEHKESHRNVVPLKYFDYVGSSTAIGTNNAAELRAAKDIFVKLKEFKLKEINVFADSKYMLEGLIEWVPKWRLNGWIKRDGQPVSAKEDWEILRSAYDACIADGTTINMNWVKGHSDDFGNISADMLATIGVFMAHDGKDISDFRLYEAKSYWKNDADRHPFLASQRLYFSSDKEHIEEGHYHLATLSDKIPFGKKTPEVSYQIVKLKKPDHIIEIVRSKQVEIANYGKVMSLRLDRVYSKYVYPMLDAYGKYPLYKGKKTTDDLYFLDKLPVTDEIYPAGLSLKALETYTRLDDVLTNYKESKIWNSHDITESLYSFENTGKKTVCILKSEFGVGVKDLKVSVNVVVENEPYTVEIPLIFGLDLLGRNGLKKIEGEHPKILLITWMESTAAMCYAVVIESDSATGVWSNYHASVIFLNN